MDAFLLSKKSSLEFCIQRARACVAMPAGIPFDQNETLQDAAALSVLRAIELAIGAANHAAEARNLGVQEDIRSGLTRFVNHGLISGELAHELRNLVAFKETVTRTELDPKALQIVVETKLDHLVGFFDVMLDQTNPSN